MDAANNFYTAVTIADAASLSAAIDLSNQRLSAIQIPASWTAAVLTFQVSADGVNYSNLYTQAMAEYSISVTSSKAILVSPVDFLGIRYLKLRSGTAASPVTQTGDKIVNLITVPL